MSHLSILPTVLRDADTLAASLRALGLEPSPGGLLEGFAAEREPVELQVRLTDGEVLGWARQSDGSLALVGDLQRLSRCRGLQALIGRITRAYAARRALAAAELQFSGATIELQP